MLLEILFPKTIVLINDNHVAVAIFCNFDKIKARIEILKGHIDVRSHFAKKPCTLEYICDSFYAKILLNKVFFTYHYNCILIFISST